MDGNIQIVIYRDKYTGEIKNWHKMRKSITQEMLDNYNNNDHETKAEIVTLEEKSVAHYFFTLKVAEITDYKENFQEIMDILDDLSCRLDSQIGECDRLIKTKKGEQEC